jgi:hypothetical protein
VRFRLPIRPMYRPPSKAYGSMSNRRSEGQAWAHEIAKEMSEDEEVKRLWGRKDDKGLIALCKKAEWEAADPAFVTATMIYTSLKGLLR